ncbi:MAG: exodeoxyribonuclease V subunit beta [Rudaea sp.]
MNNESHMVLDWRSTRLDGRILIEASAGTGKTFTIGLIFLRLLLEHDLRVEQILVATFTERAAQELRERLRLRLVEAEHAMRSLADGVKPADDASLHAWLFRFCENGTLYANALRRIRLARADLDRAPIGTIHALCQRILREHPIESGAALLPEKLVDENVLLRECVEDFWRKRYLVGHADSDEAEIVVEKGVAALISDLRGLIDVDARILPLDDPEEMRRDVQRLRKVEHVQLLRSFATKKSLYAKQKRALSSRFTEFADILEIEHGDIVGALGNPKASYIEAHLIVEQLSDEGKVTLIDHELIVLLQKVRVSAVARGRTTRARVLSDAIAFCRDEIPRRARQRDVQTFSMLIDTVHARLIDANAGREFADTLFASFPAALIDEFQDTDGRQFEIFDRIYRDRNGNTRGLLSMIGDPKQAIYGFRGGDLAAYLRARQRADEQFALTVNRRSSAPLIAAVNSLYANTDGGFNDAVIRYPPAEASGNADKTPFATHGKVIARPLSIHRFAHEEDQNASALDERALDDCAHRIVELLNDAHRTIGTERVRPGDIAVLTRTNRQIDALRQRLIAHGVPCVGSGRGSVFDTEIARDLELVLFAVLNSDDERAVRGALCTRLLGATLRDLRDWQMDETRFELQLQRFSDWHALARSLGVQAFIQTLIAERAADVLALPEGERVMTDLRHLGELLGGDDDASRGVESAYNRLATLRRENEEDDVGTSKSRRLRIESDSARVQLMTIHAAKGLQFPIVFVPFAWRVSDGHAARTPQVLRFHDENGEPCIDLGSRHFERHVAQHFDEELQERLRLLYVAMTRAKYAVHLYWTDRNGPPQTGAKACGTAALDVLIDQTQRKLGLAFGKASLRAMADRCEGIDIVEPFAGAPARFYSADASTDTRAARSPPPATRPFQWLHSFSSITRHTTLTTDESAASDEIEAQVDVEREVAAEESEQVTDDPSLLSLDTWRGRHFGNALHAILENAESGDVWPEQRDLLARHLMSLGVRTTVGDPLEPVGRMVDRVRQTDLGEGLRLMDLHRETAISEFEFQFPVNAASLSDLREVCERHGCGDAISPSLSTPKLNGMLTGFADLIFLHGGRYHVLDYKTNWLGNRLRDYESDPLDAAMIAHHYPLQALIYTVALHRYLCGRLDGYTAERHLGESWYLFVRAVGLGDDRGVWRRRWPAELIEALDDALAGVAA